MRISSYYSYKKIRKRSWRGAKNIQSNEGTNLTPWTNDSISKLVATTETKDQVERRFLLNIVVRERTPIFQLLTSKDQTLLIRRDSLLILNFRLDVVDRVGRFHIQSDGLTRERFHKDLHTAAETEDQVKSGFLLDVIVGERASIFQLFAGKDEALLIRGDAFLVLNLGLDIVNGVTRLNIEGNRLSGQSLDKDLHATTQAEHEMEGRLFLDVVIRKGATVFKLLSGKDEALLIRGDALLVLNLGLDIINAVNDERKGVS